MAVATARNIVLSGWLLGASLLPVAGWAEFVFLPTQPSVTGQTSLGVTRTLFDTRGGGTQTEQSLVNDFTFQAGGRGYIWRPWFSDLSALATLNIQNDTGWGESDSETNWDGSIRSRLDLVPRSPFPFSADLSYTRNDTGTEVWDLGLDQRWKTWSPRLPDFTFAYDFNRRTTDDNLNWSHRFASTMDGSYLGHDYRVLLNILDLNFDNDDSEGSTTTINLDAQHRKEWWQDFQVSEFAAFYDSRTRNDGLAGRSGVDSDGQRANAVLSWAPTREWSISGGLSVSRDRSGTLAGDSFKREEVSANAAVTRRFGLTHRITGSVDYQQIWSETDGVERGANLSYSWTPDRIEFSDITYTRDFSLQAGWRRTTTGPDTQTGHTLSATASHGLSGDFPLLSSMAGWDFTQSLFASRNQGESDGGIEHRGALRWSSSGERVDDTVVITLADARSPAGDFRQTADFLASRRGEINENSRWDLSFDWQWSREQEDGVRTIERGASTEGSLTMRYERGNMFGIFNLYYASGLNLNFGHDSEEDEFSRSSEWTNALYYRLGRLSAQLSFDVTEDDEGAVGVVRLDIRRRWDSR